MFWDRYSTFFTILTNLFEFFYVDPNDPTTFFLHFNVWIADKPYKTDLYDLDDKFFWKFRKFAKKWYIYMVCTSMKNAPLRSYKALKKGKNCKKC